MRKAWHLFIFVNDGIIDEFVAVAVAIFETFDISFFGGFVVGILAYGHFPGFGLLALHVVIAFGKTLRLISKALVFV